MLYQVPGASFHHLSRVLLNPTRFLHFCSPEWTLGVFYCALPAIPCIVIVKSFRFYPYTNTASTFRHIIKYYLD